MAGGRPPKYDSAEALYTACADYFNSTRKPTITGLALALGFCDRQSLNDYEEKEEFSFIIKRARLMVENSYEMRLSDDGSPTGAIFALKNMGWRDKTEQDITSGGEKITGYTIEVLNEAKNSNK